jgi:hypothetical protein
VLLIVKMIIFSEGEQLHYKYKNVPNILIKVELTALSLVGGLKMSSLQVDLTVAVSSLN